MGTLYVFINNNYVHFGNQSNAIQCSGTMQKMFNIGMRNYRSPNINLISKPETIFFLK